jgi:DeoR/GlpR family transcriptional regulator of sugar metabolism
VPRARQSDAAVEQRRRDILAYIADQREVRIHELAERFGVSLMTVHRDLDELAERRLVRKLRGKASAFSTLTTEEDQRVKEALGAEALKQVRAGETVFVDDSTTLSPLVNGLVEIEGLTVVTNSLRAAHILTEARRVEVILLGGRYHGEFDSCIGPDTLATLERTRADIAFVSVTAVAVGRLYHPVQDYAELKKAALRAANRNVLVVDHSKFGRTATYAHGVVGDYDLLITDHATPTEEIEAALNSGTAVELVECVEEGQPYDS